MAPLGITPMTLTYDFVIIGGGIIGLTVAHELRRRNKKASILLLEKETKFGLHSSGRNSGVLHSGIYYSPGTLKAQMCSQGAKEMEQFCTKHHLPINRIGKIILPTQKTDSLLMHTLCCNGNANGVSFHIINSTELKKLEPEANSITGKALYVPQTSVIDPLSILKQLVRECHDVDFQVGSRLSFMKNVVKIYQKQWKRIYYGTLINCAGLYADKVAYQLGYHHQFDILPIKGCYYKLDKTSGIKINHLIYPVPDLNMPFLGVHFTSAVNGVVYIGPTAIPALARENYKWLDDVNLKDTTRILYLLVLQFLRNKQNFRQFAITEGSKIFKSCFVRHAQKLIPNIDTKHLLSCDKVGIRPQLVNSTTGELLMDMLVVKQDRNLHVLNAISPAFTCSFPFARFVVEKLEQC